MQDDMNNNGLVLPIPSDDVPGCNRDIQAFLSYWNGKRRAGGVPLRTDIDPRGIEPLLANAFIIEQIATGLARFRIAGSYLADLMGMEVRGMPLSAFINLEDRHRLRDVLVDAFERPAIIRIELFTKGNCSRHNTTGTLMLLPLQSDLGDVSRALGCLVTDGSKWRVPCRFSIKSVLMTPVHADTHFSHTQSAPTAAPHTNTVDMQNIPYAYNQLTRNERSYLRLVNNNEP